MDCPACNSAMVVLELREVEIDHCLSCGGIWLDAGELELLLEDGGGKDALLESFEPSEGAGEKKKKCPACGRKMEKVSCGTGRKVLIDRCRRNDGMWFDRKELDSMIEMGASDRDNKVLDLLRDMFGRQ